MAERARGRRPGTSGTRELIERAARRQFAELGFDRASLRSVAQEAGVDPALVKHYFGTKPQLLVAVAELPVDPAVIVPVLLEGDRDEIGLRLARLLVGVLGQDEPRRRMMSIVRAAASEPEAAEMVRSFISERLFGPVAARLDADQPELRAALCGSQTVGLVLARYVVGIPALADVSQEQLVSALAPVYQRYLTEPL